MSDTDRPPYVSFTGNIAGKTAVGWCVIESVSPLTAGPQIEGLCRILEDKRGYDADTVVITNFRRLEAAIHADKQDRPYAKLSELKDGDEIEIDADFTCQRKGVHLVHKDENGRLYFNCREGRHMLEGQADDGEHCVGIYRRDRP